MMNARTRIRMTLAAVVLTFGLFSLERPILAQSQNAKALGELPHPPLERPILAQSPNSNCKQAKGSSIEVFSGSFVTTGRITHGGILNGTTEYVYSPAFVLTPDPAVGSYIAELTITTIHGQLKTSNVYLYDFVTGRFTILARINPDTSTGKFAGATGVLYFGGKTIGDGFTYQADISGEICFANE